MPTTSSFRVTTSMPASSASTRMTSPRGCRTFSRGAKRGWPRGIWCLSRATRATPTARPLCGSWSRNATARSPSRSPCSTGWRCSTAPMQPRGQRRSGRPWATSSACRTDARAGRVCSPGYSIRQYCRGSGRRKRGCGICFHVRPVTSRRPSRRSSVPKTRSPASPCGTTCSRELSASTASILQTRERSCGRRRKRRSPTATASANTATPTASRSSSNSSPRSRSTTPSRSSSSPTR